MEIANDTPFSVDSLTWKLKGMWMATLVVKATFTLRRGSSPLAASQEPITADDEFFDGNPSASLRIPSDLMPFKPLADVVLVGYAYGVPGKPTNEVYARLRLGSLDKVVRVRAEHPFERIAIRYEGAVSARDNPVGARGGRTPHLHAEGVVACFGPLNPSWAVRSQFVSDLPGFTLQQLENNELPDGLDPKFFNVAPRDQQVTSLDPTSELTLEHLHPVHPKVVTRLEAPKLVVRETRAGGTPKRVFMRCDMLWIDSDRGICTATWRGQTSLEQPDMDVRFTVEAEEPSTISDDTGAIPLSTNDIEVVKATFDDMSTVAVDAVMMAKSALPFDQPANRRLRPKTTPAPPMNLGAAPAPIVSPPPIAERKPATPQSPWAANVAVRAELKSPQREVEPPAPLVSDNAAPAKDEQPAAPRTIPKSSSVIQLVWYSSEIFPRVRRRWDQLLDRLEDHPPDPELDACAQSDSAEDVEHHREIFQVLVSGDAVGPQGLEQLAASGVREDGKLVPPLVLVEGELTMAFDALRRLERAVAIADSMTGAEGPARTKIDVLKELLASGALDSQMTVVDELYRDLSSAFSREARSLPNRYLDQQVDRVLLGKRSYDKRTLFGGEQLRGHLRAPSGRTGGVPTYTPIDCEALLPLFRSFSVRMLAEVHPRQEEAEAHGVALRVRGLGRVVPLRRS